MKLSNLHPDIQRDLFKMGRMPIEVIDPSPGLFGGDPIPGLVSVVYLCPDAADCPMAGPNRLPDGHTHQALYGPPCETVDGKLVPVRGAEGMVIYAD